MLKNKKKILYIKNNFNGKNLDYLNKFFDIDFYSVNSTDLIDKDILYLNELVNFYDIIIIGGGPQHLTTNYIDSHPEIINQIELVKIILNTNKLLIGICLGCQIIGKTFGLEINQMDKLCLGFDYLDINSIDYNFITNQNDKYLSKIDFNLLSKSFSYHYDCVNCKSNNNENSNLHCVGYSKFGVPYILKHSTANIYGFQFHPEVTHECVLNIVNSYPNISIETEQIKNNSEIYLHFFEIFINS